MFLKAVERERSADVKEIADMQKLLNVARQANAFTTATGNVGTGEDDLISYALPDGILTNNGQRLEFEAAFTFASNVNNKRIKLKFGGTTIYDSGALALNGGGAVLRAVIIRTGASAQVYSVTVDASLALLANMASVGTAAVDLTAPVTFKATGEATSNDDIIQKYLTVNWWPGG